MQLNNRSFGSSIMPVTKHLLIINLIVWLATLAFGRAGIIDLEQYLGLHFWLGSDFNPAQLFTYMFMHDTRGIAHIFFNMFSLWMFGSLIEKVLGSKRFLFYYISCGLGAALVQELVWQFSWQDMFNSISAQFPGYPVDQFYNLLVTVGASGAVFGILLAFGMIFPNMSMYIIPFPFPIKAKWVVLGYGAIELFFGISHTMNGVAHFAHLGGMLVGILLILYWKHNGTLTRGNGFY